MTVVFAGGGTGGHVYPAIAIADALRGRPATIAFIGTANRLEGSIVPKAGYPLYTIHSHWVPRRLSLEIARTALANFFGTLQSLRILASLKPDIVIATGGYVCFPVALAARLRRWMQRGGPPVVLLEPNVAAGLTNRVLAPIVDEIWHRVPIRASLRRLPARETAAKRLGLDPSRRSILVIGGSQGARTINDAIAKLVREGRVPAGWQVLHLTGERDYARVTASAEPVPRNDHRYVILPYLDDMADAYAAADLVVARAGASTLGELAALGKPAILVPYPFAAEAHQAANAARMRDDGAALIIEDSQVRAGELPAVLITATQSRRLQEMTGHAQRLQGSDPLATILARIDTLVARRPQGAPTS